MSTKQPKILYGAWVGLLLSVALIALFYLGAQAAGLPLVPLDALDWAARGLGDIVPQMIGLMVDFVTAVFPDTPTDIAGKTLQQLSALAGFVVGGAVAGMILFAVLRWRRFTSWVAGAVLGVVMGVPFLLMSSTVYRGTVPPLVNAIWILGAFGVWGAVMGWSFDRLTVLEPEAEAAPTAERMDRRTFLIRLGGASAVITVAGAGIGRLLASQRAANRRAQRETAESIEPPETLPNAGAEVEPAPGTRPEYTPVEDHYRIDINAMSQNLDAETWRLELDGMVENPLSLSVDDLRTNYEPMHQYITLACISNPIAGDLTSTTRWTGVSLQEVLAEAGIQEGAEYLNLESADGFHEAVALDLINADERIMLAYAWDGKALPDEHGYPLRIYIPDRYGMKQPKWITHITVSDEKETGFWVKRGWNDKAQMRATSVIDTVATDSLIEIEEEDQTLVPIGGIAHAGARGISKVEVQVNDGDWTEAQLREPLSPKTWVIWRYEWPFEEGEHRFAVRCYDEDGEMQVSEETDNFPDGATGLHEVSRTLSA